MIIRFSNGAAVDAAAIASMHMEKQSTGTYGHPARIIVYSWQESIMSMGLGGRRNAAHLMSIPCNSDKEAEEELKSITATWLGIPAKTSATV